MSFQRQLREPRTSIVRFLCGKHGVSFGVVGKETYTFGPEKMRAAARADVKLHVKEVRAELLTEDLIRRAQRSARLQVKAG